MIELALWIIALYVLGRVLVGAFGLLAVIGAGISNWLEARPGRRIRLRWTVRAILAAIALLMWWLLSPATREGIYALGTLVGAAVLVCLGLDRLGWRWKVAIVWIVWGGIVVGLIAVVLAQQGRL